MTNPSFPSNSHKSRQAPAAKPEEKKVERVVTTPVSRRKKSFGKRVAELFVSGDGQSVGSYVLLDVIVPATKELTRDIVTQGIERMLFGEVRGRRYGGSSNGRVSYDRFSKAPVREEPRTLSRRSRAAHDFQEIILSTRVEGEEVLDQLFTLAEKYNVATVADLYDMVGIDTSHVDQKYGWTDLRGCKVVQVRGGYLLDLPQPDPID